MPSSNPSGASVSTRCELVSGFHAGYDRALRRGRIQWVNTHSAHRAAANHGRVSMLDFAGTVLTATLMTFIINALVMYLDIGHGMKLAIAGIAGFWIGLAAAAGASGWLAISRPFPVIGIFVVTPLLAAAITATSPAARAALLALPTRLLIGLNIARVVGILFVPLAMEGRLAGPFPYSAGWGDIITGVFAVPLL